MNLPTRYEICKNKGGRDLLHEFRKFFGVKSECSKGLFKKLDEIPVKVRVRGTVRIINRHLKFVGDCFLV